MKLGVTGNESAGVTFESGFLKPCLNSIPRSRFSGNLSDWDELAQKLPYFYENNLLAKVVANEMPPIEDESIPPELFSRMFQILTFTNSALVHPYRSKTEDSVKIIPSITAIPTVWLSKKLKRLPIMSYNEYALTNCVVNGEYMPSRSEVEIDFLSINQRFVNSKDEQGFIIPHQAMEWKGGYIPANIGNAHKCVRSDNRRMLCSILWTMAGSMQEMIGQQVLMWEFCNPENYGLEVRPQIQMFENILFEGVPWSPYNKPVTLRGETGAQSPLFATIDVFLGIKHDPTELSSFLKKMINYMTPEHKKFLEAIRRGPSVREYLLGPAQCDSELKDAYNAMVETLIKLRENHFKFMKYIPKTGEAQRGTGGTTIYRFLPQYIEETREHLIPN